MYNFLNATDTSSTSKYSNVDTAISLMEYGEAQVSVESAFVELDQMFSAYEVISNAIKVGQESGFTSGVLAIADPHGELSACAGYSHLAMESFGQVPSLNSTNTIALEEANDAKKSISDRIKTQIQKIIAWIKQFFAKLFSASERAKAAATAALKLDFTKFNTDKEVKCISMADATARMKALTAIVKFPATDNLAAFTAYESKIKSNLEAIFKVTGEQDGVVTIEGSSREPKSQKLSDAGYTGPGVKNLLSQGLKLADAVKSAKDEEGFLSRIASKIGNLIKTSDQIEEARNMQKMAAARASLRAKVNSAALAEIFAIVSVAKAGGSKKSSD